MCSDEEDMVIAQKKRKHQEEDGYSFYLLTKGGI